MLNGVAFIKLAEIGGTRDQRKTTTDQPSMTDQAHFKGFYADQASWLIRRILVTFYADQASWLIRRRRF